ncbi:ATP-binding protein [Candidatus Bathyarchaeota archaeon]|nr:ATP-binding protein [Candidatus Bathyarchaeota archaeon]
MIISIASGKGGTGKTTVAVGLALSVENVQLLDCDVEEPNVHVLLKPNIYQEKPVYSLVPQIMEEKCNYCGKCAKLCQYHTIFVAKKTFLVFPELCHSCGLCSIVCPEKAIINKERQVGIVKKGLAQGIDIVYGELNIGEPMAGPVIREVKKEVDRKKLVIIDVPPGASCPVVESVYGSDFTILVTEPTPFGLHDLKITVEVLRTLNVPLGVVVNRAGIGDKKVYEFCKKEGVPIMLEIPFSRKIAKLYSRGVSFVTEMDEWKTKFQHLLETIMEA